MHSLLMTYACIGCQAPVIRHSLSFKQAMSELELKAKGVQAEVEAAPNLWGNFMQMSGEDVPLYAAVGGYDALRPVLTTKLGEYNESNAAMELVLFQQVLLLTCGSHFAALP